MLKRLTVGAFGLALLALQVAPVAIAAYYPPTAAFGPATGDCTTPSAGSAAFTCGKSNGVPFGSMAFGSATNPVTSYSAGEVGGTQSITSASGTVSPSASMVYVNNSAAVALAGPASPVVGQHFTIKDGSAAAATNNITYTPGSGITIDGASSYVLKVNSGAINVWVVSATVQVIY